MQQSLVYNGTVLSSPMHSACSYSGLADSCDKSAMLSNILPLLLSTIERNPVFTNCHLFFRENGVVELKKRR